MTQTNTVYHNKQTRNLKKEHRLKSHGCEVGSIFKMIKHSIK